MTTEFLRARYELLKIHFGGLRLLTQNSALDMSGLEVVASTLPVGSSLEMCGEQNTPQLTSGSTFPACHTQDRTAETFTVASPAAI